jgi:hypothetical protein
VKRVFLALLFGAAITVLPWLLRPLLGDAVAILWLPGFAATAHWFPAGLNGPHASAAKTAGCSVNVLIWAAVFLVISFSAGRRLTRRARRNP